MAGTYAKSPHFGADLTVLLYPDEAQKLAGNPNHRKLLFNLFGAGFRWTAPCHCGLDGYPIPTKAEKELAKRARIQLEDYFKMAAKQLDEEKETCL